MTKPIKAITLHQPWAAFVMAGIKQYETRSWMTKHRGLLAIHAGKTWSRDLMWQYLTLKQNHAAIQDHAREGLLVFGAVLGVCRLVETHRVETIRENLSALELAVGNYDDLRFAWELEIIEVFDTPHPARGEQGLWEWTP